jgi:hypothetical protein
VALNVHEVSDSNNDLLDLLSQLTGGGEDEGLALLDIGVELLEDGDRESGSLSGTRLGLSNDIVSFVLLALPTNSV